MELTNLADIKKLLLKNGIVLTKARGQNFIINPSVCPRMAEECGAGKDDGVLEIGPGIGVLTAELAKVAGKVVSIELDSGLVPILSETLSNFDNVKIIEGDALKLNLKEIIEREFSGKKVFVCANIPYNISSKLVMKLLESNLNHRGRNRYGAKGVCRSYLCKGGQPSKRRHNRRCSLFCKLYRAVRRFGRKLFPASQGGQHGYEACTL